jgi:hypothetical protein
MEMDLATQRLYLGDPAVDKHDCILHNTHSILASSSSHVLLLSFYISMQLVWFLTHSSSALIDPLYLCGSSSTLAECSWMYAICVVPHALLPRIHGSTQFVWIIMPRYPVISCNPLPMLLEPERLLLQNSLSMPSEMQQNVDDGQSMIQLPQCATSWLSKYRDALP